MGIDSSKPLLAFATQGSGGDDEARLKVLISGVAQELFAFDKKQKVAMLRQLLAVAQTGRHAGLVMEGSGMGGGVACILSKLLYGTRYVVSSGDGIEPFLTSKLPLGKPLFWLYEKLLYACSVGFIGWTPYLVGRALTMGAPRGMTAAGWAPFPQAEASALVARREIRLRLGIPEDAIVFGIVGSLAWSERKQYCYGMELVQAIGKVQRREVCVLVVGDGDGRVHLERVAGASLNQTVFLPGRVKRDEVPGYLAAMDIGSLPQSVDGVGAFRFTTKISEYFSQRLPYVTNQIPAGYDLDFGGIWRLAGDSPWDPRFLDALSELMSTVSAAEIAAHRAAVPPEAPEFDRELQVQRVTAFLEDVFGDNAREKGK